MRPTDRGGNDGEVDVELVRRWVDDATRIVVLTGAGVSTDSGIPDFRGPNGLWTRNPEAQRAATLQHYLGDPEVRRSAWRARVESPTWHAEPNEVHRRLVALETGGRLDALVTQNVDGLHQTAGSDPERVVEVHGSMHRTCCWSCRDRRPMTEALDRVREGDPDPACLVCGGILKSDTISFGQALEPDVIDRALQAAERCELLLALGTSLQVYPVANMVPRAVAAGARVAILNGEPTKLDHLAGAVVLGPLAELVPAVLA